MKKLFALLLLLPVFFFSQNKKPSELFWDQLQKHCGKAFEGKLISGGSPNDGFSGKKLIMHVRSCAKDELRIPFFVGDDKSRTWVLKMDANKVLSLKHDHRHADGTPEKITQYGGYGSNVGLENLQMFAADAATAAMLPKAASNVWWFTIDGEKFTYNLRRIGSERQFTVQFDLTKPTETPGASWGNEE